MNTLKYLIDQILHVDRHLSELSSSMGSWLYAILALIIFCETGLIVTPFLPGDSLLFAVGALMAIPEANLDPGFMFLLLTASAILGDAVNYAAGWYIGPKVFRSESSRLLNRNHLIRAQEFYERYGGKAIFLARFAPIVRTFAPFVAGIGRMNTLRFWTYNISGAICWVGTFLFLGYFFGNLPLVKRYFSFVIFGIIGVSLLPIAFEWYRARRSNSAAPPTT